MDERAPRMLSRSFTGAFPEKGRCSQRPFCPNALQERCKRRALSQLRVKPGNPLLFRNVWFSAKNDFWCTFGKCHERTLGSQAHAQIVQPIGRGFKGLWLKLYGSEAVYMAGQIRPTNAPVQL